jgi:hypothetical protein
MFRPFLRQAKLNTLLLNQLPFIITKSLFIAVFLHAYENRLHDFLFAYEDSYEDNFIPEETVYSLR